ncbi:restriction endonuclease [Paenibacillus amylolyticus]|uniref:Restriction endonuclease n=1 Tax=Paenibacillus amylolyticus TaxID=1451 RepID=A0A5M9WLT1_PAEAM|nr:restriction endonuclease [Paenibacillus amylolyticus]KAA8782524.1 restriction endonuclease [Paenibacillus amylolyticus]
MARRKSKAKQEEELFQGLAGMAMLGGILGTYSLTKSWQPSIIVGFVGVVGIIILMVIIQQKRAERLKRSGITEIDKMDGVQFEHYLGHLFCSQGFKAEVTKAAGDYGADLVISKDGKRIVVQAKRYKKNVGLKAVQEVQGAKAHYRANGAWVVTNSNYTEQAYQLAKSNGVRLIARDELVEMLLVMKEKFSASKKAANAKRTA